MRKVLIIEDDSDISNLVALHLNDAGYHSERIRNGADGLKKASSGAFDLIVLDVMLPGLDGLEICKRLRIERVQTPVLMLTAKSEELDRVLGLELGADDYLTKPFSVRELVARVRAIFRRIDMAQETVVQDEPPRSIQHRELSIDREKREVLLRDRPVDLTAKEFELLALFANHPGRCYTRQQLLDLVWGYQYSGYEHTVNSHINRLRSKIEKDPSRPTYIQTVWGVGYKLAE